MKFSTKLKYLLKYFSYRELAKNVGIPKSTLQRIVKTGKTEKYKELMDKVHVISKDITYKTLRKQGLDKKAQLKIELKRIVNESKVSIHTFETVLKPPKEYIQINVPVNMPVISLNVDEFIMGLRGTIIKNVLDEKRFIYFRANITVYNGNGDIIGYRTLTSKTAQIESYLSVLNGFLILLQDLNNVDKYKNLVYVISSVSILQFDFKGN